MIYLVSNFGKSRLAEGAAISTTDLVLPAGHGDKFPSPTTGQGFWVLVGSPTQQPDLVLCTHRAGDVLTVTPLTKDWGISTQVMNPVNAELLDAFVQRVELGSAAFESASAFATPSSVAAAISGLTAIASSVSGPDKPPTSASEWDDEFGASALNSKWVMGPTISDGEGSTPTIPTFSIDDQWGSFLRVVLNTSANTFLARQAFSPNQSAQFSITAKAAIGLVQTYNTFSVLLMNSALSDGFRFSIEYGSSGPRVCLHYKTAGSWTYNSSTSAIAALTGTYWIHIQTRADELNKFYVYYSLNGMVWTLVGSFTKSFTLAYAAIKLSLGGGTSPQICGIDWFRVNHIFLP